jgi:hypothetical protein
VIGGYESAARKAQVVFTVDGVCLGLLTASVTSTSKDLAAAVCEVQRLHADARGGSARLAHKSHF